MFTSLIVVRGMIQECAVASHLSRNGLPIMELARICSQISVDVSLLSSLTHP